MFINCKALERQQTNNPLMVFIMSKNSRNCNRAVVQGIIVSTETETRQIFFHTFVIAKV